MASRNEAVTRKERSLGLSAESSEMLAHGLLELARGGGKPSTSPHLHPALLVGAAAEIIELSRRGEIDRLEAMVRNSATLRLLLARWYVTQGRSGVALDLIESLGSHDEEVRLLREECRTRIATSAAFAGRTFKDRYLVEEMIGQGGTSVAYRGRDLEADTPVAIKILKAEHAGDDEIVKHFQREAKLLERLDHPNTVKFLDVGREPGGELFLVMELLDGTDVERLLRRSPAGLGEEKTLQILDGVAAALEVAHAEEIIHRDIKPSNVMICGTRVKLFDFGIAKVGADGSSPFFAPTAAGIVLFTPQYASPEQIAGDRIDHRSDIYSLGALGYACLAGHPPFTGLPEEIIQSHLRARVPRLTGVSARVEELVRTLLEKRPDDRLASARAVRRAIAWLRGSEAPTRIDRF